MFMCLMFVPKVPLEIPGAIASPQTAQLPLKHMAFKFDVPELSELAPARLPELVLPCDSGSASSSGLRGPVTLAGSGTAGPGLRSLSSWGTEAAEPSEKVVHVIQVDSITDQTRCQTET